MANTNVMPIRETRIMSITVPGLHHVTAISGPPQDNLDFYSGTLGQRLVKKTVNFDDPGTYHLYYGDAAGTPGTITTFFPFADAGPGRAGAGMASAVAYVVSDLDARMEALALAAVDIEGPWERLGQRGIATTDPDGLRVELIEDAAAEAGFHSVTLWLDDPEPTAEVLEAMGYARAGTEAAATMGSGGAETRLRLVSSAPERGPVVDIVTSDAPSIGRPGAGTIHHVAFRARDAAEQRAWRETLLATGLDVTPVIDRQYFDAIYFRTPGGVLFEIATDPPGFAVDEDPAHLGEALKLPPRYESMRDRIERVLPPLRGPRRAA
jgi:glyoxalase family protein